ncbi:hypothetical protein [Caudoviricetes sp.]|nr:hypothetical protein [Caudoviricetes sp.]
MQFQLLEAPLEKFKQNKTEPIVICEVECIQHIRIYGEAHPMSLVIFADTRELKWVRTDCLLAMPAPVIAKK